MVISNGRVIDPETGLDAIRNVGIDGSTVESVSESVLDGKKVVDATGFIVCPGFIDLHSHGQDEENYQLQARDGVTSALELEVGTSDVDRWYAQRDGKTLINYGASVGHIPVRMSVMKDPADFIPVGDAAHKPATPSEIGEMSKMVRFGLQRGAIAVGMGIMYTPAATHWEILEIFRASSGSGASCHVHLRGHGFSKISGGVSSVQEVLAASVITRVPLHVVHIASTGLGATSQMLQVIKEARSRGIDITTECYPYSAGMTGIEAATFDGNWKQNMGIDYGDLEWAETGERLTEESFNRYRETGGMVILHMIPESVVDTAVNSPLTSIASDGYIKRGKGHPRTAGTYSRVLGKYVRCGDLTMVSAIRKMSLMPAQRLETRVPMMKQKGRLQLGSDADIVIFDPETISDMSTYQQPTVPSRGIHHVLVNGIQVVNKSKLVDNTVPGCPIRAPLS